MSRLASAVQVASAIETSLSQVQVEARQLAVDLEFVSYLNSHLVIVASYSHDHSQSVRGQGPGPGQS